MKKRAAMRNVSSDRYPRAERMMDMSLAFMPSCGPFEDLRFFEWVAIPLLFYQLSVI